MLLKANSIFENKIFNRYLFFISLILVPILTYWLEELSPLYVLIVIFLGRGFSSMPKWFLFLASLAVVVIRHVLVDVGVHFAGFTIRILIYASVALISSNVTEQLKERKKNKTEIITALTKLLDSRDTYTANHSENVARYSLIIAKGMGLSREQCESIYIGGLLHDIGKIGISKSILTKPSKLTYDEYESIKQHSLIGYESIKHLSWCKTNGILDMILYHHERFNGTGYPYGLKGEEIPIAARIISIADSFDAMTSKRIYNTQFGLEYALAEIKKNIGTQFDPDIANLFLEIVEMKEIDVFGKIFDSPQKTAANGI